MCDRPLYGLNLLKSINSNGARDTVTAHHDKCCVIPSDSRVLDEAKSANAEIRKAVKDHPLPS
jgi:hypothetical protein